MSPIPPATVPAKPTAAGLEAGAGGGDGAPTDGTGAALVATADTFGLTLAPTASGALAGGGVFASEVAHLLPPLDGAGTTFAYQIEIQLPGDLVGQDLRADFDLFGNGDSVVSRGYGLALPEPDGVWLLALGGVVLGTVGWWRRRS